MKKNDKERAQRIFDARRKGMKPGFCHGCGIFVTELTDEHAPPRRTQLLIPERYLVRNPIGMVKQHNLSKRPLPPAVRGVGGFKFRSFCKICQQKTQDRYGDAFHEWAMHGQALGRTVTEFDGDGRVTASVSIRPLNVLKQMVSNVLAVSRYAPRDYLKQKLRRFVQNPAARTLPAGVWFLVFLCPVRPDYELPQCRFEHGHVVLDTTRSITTMLVAEIVVPPWGVVAVADDQRLPHHLLPLMNVNRFGDFQLDERVTVDLDVPVRTVFGPAPLRYWQDARRETSDPAAPGD